MSKKVIIGVVVAALVLIAVVMPSLIRARTSKASIACIMNLREIVACKRQWMVENRKTTNGVPTWDDIRPYMGQERHCPEGGTYTIGHAKQPPTCSVGGRDHTLPEGENQ